MQEAIKMDKKTLLEAISKMRDAGKERKFEQTAEFIINFRDMDMKKPDNRIDVTVVLPHEIGKTEEAKAMVFVKDKEFAAALKGKHDYMMEDEIAKIPKKKINEMLNTYNVFFAEGPVMLTVGKYLGQDLAPKNMMPRPIEPNIKAVETGLAGVSTGLRVTNTKGKNMPVVHCPIGKQGNSDDVLAENALAVYGAVVNTLPQKDHNVKSTFVKLTMSPAIKVGAKETQE